MSWDKIVKVLAAAAGAVLGLFGEWTNLHTILVVLMLTDYITGCVVAALGRSPKSETGGLSSKVGFIGLAKKGFIMAIVLLATMLDRALGNTSLMFQSAALCYYIANEGLSILENAGLLGVPYPAKLRKALESLREKDKEDEDDTEE
jgi:toxin secretion/phage lysis holin